MIKNIAFQACAFNHQAPLTQGSYEVHIIVDCTRHLILGTAHILPIATSSNAESSVSQEQQWERQLHGLIDFSICQ